MAAARLRIEIERYPDPLRGYWYYAMIERTNNTFLIVQCGEAGDPLTAANRASNALGKWIQQHGDGHAAE